MYAGRWSKAPLPDLTGRRAIVTGASSGLGKATALALAEAGAQVVLAVRDQGRGEAAMAYITRRLPDASVMVELLDLADLSSVRDFASRMVEIDLDMLVNNAGVMATPLRRTVDGFELQFGTNHLGHFALTGLLLPALLRTPGSRVVTLSSLAARAGMLDFQNLNAERSYSSWGAYGQAKLANLMFALDLHRRLTSSKAVTSSMAAHPGLASTNLAGHSAGLRGVPFAKVLNRVGSAVLTQSATAGTLPILQAVAAPLLPGGSYLGPAWLGETRGPPAPSVVAPMATDVTIAGELWQRSVALTGVDYAALQ